MSEILNLNPKLLVPDLKETARYLGYKVTSTPNDSILSQIQKASDQVQAIISPQATFDIFDFSISDFKTISFATYSFDSKDLAKNLHKCNRVVLLAATLGPKIDMLIRKNQNIDTAYAAILQATGAMFIEAFVDYVNEQIKSEQLKKGLIAHPRFSPGYGDLSLDLQKTFFSVLPCQRIGLTLMDSLIMAPEKSVTAFIGLEQTVSS